MPVLTRVSQATRPLGSSAMHGVEDAVGDLVADLVRVALGDGLGSEEVLALGERLDGLTWRKRTAKRASVERDRPRPPCGGRNR